MSIIKSEHTVEIRDLIKEFSKKHDLEWNESCEEIDHDTFLNRQFDILEVDEKIDEMSNNEYYLRAFEFIRDLMKENNVSEKYWEGYFYCCRYV